MSSSSTLNFKSAINPVPSGAIAESVPISVFDIFTTPVCVPTAWKPKVLPPFFFKRL